MAITPWWQAQPPQAPPFNPNQKPGGKPGQGMPVDPNSDQMFPPRGTVIPRPRGPAGQDVSRAQATPQPVAETPQTMGALPPRLQSQVESGSMPPQQALGMYTRFLGANPTAPGNQNPVWAGYTGTPPTVPQMSQDGVRERSAVRQGHVAGQGAPPGQPQPFSGASRSGPVPVPGPTSGPIPIPGGGPPQTIPNADNPGTTSGPVPILHPGLGQAGQVHHFQGVNVTLPNRPLTQQERDVLSGLSAGQPLGGPAAAAIYQQLLAEGIVDKPYPGYEAPAPPPPPGVPRPGAPPLNTFYTQNPGPNQEQFSAAAAASAYRPMSTQQRWERYLASRPKPAPPAKPQKPDDPGGSPPFYPGGGDEGGKPGRRPTQGY